MAGFFKKEKNEKEEFELKVDIYQNPDEFLIFAQVPGAKIEDLNLLISEEGDTLSLEGEIKIPFEKWGEKKEWLHQECAWGKFFRQIILPENVDVEKIEAKLKNGVLFLRLPLVKPEIKGKKKILVSEE